ncbi:hypothetical protein SDC9_87294 [bioreactor metagenome]|uniref:Uncharacterized protein n=1 Tax=bioreactor metagenome TaxID=1076179 RepID=A0A644ZIE7_9ZZZZ
MNLCFSNFQFVSYSAYRSPGIITGEANIKVNAEQLITAIPTQGS